MFLGEELTNLRVTGDIAQRYKKGDLVPMAVGLVQDHRQRFLIVTDKNGFDGLLRGQIGPQEKLTHALRRGLKDQVGIKDLMTVRHLFSQDVSYPSNARRIEGFLTGAKYYLCQTQVRRASDLLPNREKVSAARWGDLAELASVCSQLNGDFAGIVATGLVRLGYEINSSDFHKDLKSWWF